MSSLMATLYDRIMEPTEAACMRDWRRALLSRARGEVLEIGSGTGANVAHYGESVRSVTFTEPDDGMRSRLEQKLLERPRPWDHRVVPVAVEELPFDDDVFDTVVSTLVLCSVNEPLHAVEELRRVLRPGGELLFIEHVAAEPGTRRRLWQRIVNPVWKRVAGNCHCTRETGTTLEAGGFEIVDVTSASMRKAPSFVRPTIRGVAT